MSKKISLAVDCRMYSMSGIGTYLKNVLLGLINSGKYELICLGYRELGAEVWFDKVRFIEVKSRPLHPFEQVEIFFKVPRCDIYFTPHFNTPWIKPWRAGKMISTIHDVYHLANPAQYNRFLLLYIRMLIWFTVRNTTKVFTVSHFSEREILRFFPHAKDKLVVSYLGVSGDFDEVSDADVDFKYLLYVGNVKPHKNVQAILQAMPLIADKEIKLVIVGKKDGFYSQNTDMDPLVSELGDRVIFTGYIDDITLKKYYRNASLFIFPSKYEGFGLPVLEAMKFKIPILASDAAAIPEVGGEAIYYFDPCNINMLAGMIDEVLSGRLSYNYGLYDEQIGRFNWEKTIDIHLNTLT
ncbi:Glycosyltransferase involved in cell wall bisynthesis [Chitinophaga sp. YR573]|uniref:glycosyltransferase family 4 protein n=1 Tax=Chitinophaga sp. YR573 TaxID=1881040 RepID=UPI0008B81CF3|nr:glycosyltransferase family 1 protein [Chitinophaga sp. YR573]SEW14485.1 Glycosyltransferase involved in cell wall bisynthesis [Chitinophaga sp. YR573]